MKWRRCGKLDVGNFESLSCNCKIEMMGCLYFHRMDTTSFIKDFFILFFFKIFFEPKVLVFTKDKKLL